MRLEAVTVCVGFSDVLSVTLPLNKQHFDDYVVVSDTRDVRTHNLCAHHNVRVVQTDHLYANQQAFNKGNGINAGLATLKLDDWVLHLDADIVLPPRAREMMQRADPDPAAIYGIDRMMCPDFNAWVRHSQTPHQQHTAQTFILPEPFPMGARVARLGHDGYLPIGFFQLWNAGVTKITDYPCEHGTAGRADMLHALRWKRRERSLIPEIIGIHVEGRLPPGVNNWRGRRGEWFGPDPWDFPHRPINEYGRCDD